MQLDRARRVFATHMAAARTRKLTAYELQELSRARQVLRRSRRPAGQSKNPKQVIKARHADVFVHNKFRVGSVVYVDRFKVGSLLSKSLFWRVFKDPAVIRDIKKIRGQSIRRVQVEFPFGKSYWFDEDVLTTVKPNIPSRKARRILREGRAQGRPLTPAQRGFFGARASGYPPKPKKNPSGLIRMGRLVEIRYHRDHGRAKGYYKHPFKQRPEIFYRPSDNTILIKG